MLLISSKIYQEQLLNFELSKKDPEVGNGLQNTFIFLLD